MKDEISESKSKPKLLNLPTSSEPSIEENSTYLGQRIRPNFCIKKSLISGLIFLKYHTNLEGLVLFSNSTKPRIVKVKLILSGDLL